MEAEHGAARGEETEGSRLSSPRAVVGERDPIQSQTICTKVRIADVRGTWGPWASSDGPLCVESIGRVQGRPLSRSPLRICIDMCCRVTGLVSARCENDRRVRRLWWRTAVRMLEESGCHWIPSLFDSCPLIRRRHC